MSQYADQLGFAAGTLIGIRKDISGITPVRFGVLQDVSVDFSADLKELYGQGRYSIALAPGKTKIEVKAKFAGLKGNLFNHLYFGATSAKTQIVYTDNEPGVIPSATAYIVTVSKSATFIADCGVFYALTGQPLTLVASAPTVGQYMVAAGVYTFAVADASAAVYISYTAGSTAGIMIPLTNVRMGTGPSFQLVLDQPFDGRAQTLILNNCQTSKFSLPSKQDDWTIAEMDIMCSADISGNIGTLSMSNA
ncbi:MAG: hypothetical protein JWO51_146 [Rhodospirillales bacterium]|nr:hypothetical protein [Rhodospirillales bacterium]